MKIKSYLTGKQLGNFQLNFVCKCLGTKDDAGHMTKMATM